MGGTTAHIMIFIAEATEVIVSPEFAFVDDAHYILMGRTHAILDVHFRSSLTTLCKRYARTVSSSRRMLLLDRVHDELFLVFNHFSLKHGGSNLGIGETKSITDLLFKKGSKRAIHVEFTQRNDRK
jgi:hypothetical protein